MLSEKIGIILKKNTKNKLWWLKLAISLILSNIFFFTLFSKSQSEPEDMRMIPDGKVEIQLRAELLTPFHPGKKILIVNREKKVKIEAVLISQVLEETGPLTVLVNEKEANQLFHYTHWEILPYMRYLSFASRPKDQQHEIRY